MPWKSAGVGAGGEVEIAPHAETSSATATVAAIDRMVGTGGRLAPGRETRDRGYDDRPSEAHVTAANRGRRNALRAAGLVAALLAGLATTATAAETAPLSRLDTPMADLVVLEPLVPSETDPATPMLLVLDSAAPAPNLAHLSILERTHEWVPAFGADVDVERDDLSARWFVALSARHFALIATTPTDAPGTGHAVVIGFDVQDQAGSPTIVETARTRFDHAIETAGAADVDGFGTAELVVGPRPVIDASGSCGTTSLRVLDGVTLDVRRSIDLPGRVGGGVLGDWDEAPGDDLLAYASLDCPPGGPGGVRLLAVRLRDGTRSTLSAADTGSDVDVHPPPLRVHLEGMAHDHAVVMLAEGIAIVDAVGGDPVKIGMESGAPLVAGPDPDAQGPATRIAWIDGSGLHAERVRAGPSGLIVRSARTDVIAQDSIEGSRWHLLLQATFGDILAHGSSSAWLGDVVDEGCPDLILPGAILPCGSADLRPGAGWLATRPIAAMPIEGRRSLLIAAGLGWDPDGGLPATPTPWAAGPAGWWRNGPSTPFAVSEVRADNVTYFQDYPSPAATIEKMTAADGTTLLPGFTGTRLFVTVVPLADEESGPDVAPSRLEGLTAGAGPNGIATVVRVPIPPGNESGRDGSYATLALGDVRLPGAERTTRWAIQAVPINDWGEVGFPVVRTIVRDAVGPTLNMEEPFTSPVWPFQARLPGRSEPGSSVSIDGGGEIPVDERGRFTVVTHLAPWPQTIRLTATDSSGNASTAEFSIIGGVDYRRFPWALIAALALLGVVAARGLVTAGRTRSGAVEATPWSTGTLDEGSMPEIEDLPPGKGLAPADGGPRRD